MNVCLWSSPDFLLHDEVLKVLNVASTGEKMCKSSTTPVSIHDTLISSGPDSFVLLRFARPASLQIVNLLKFWFFCIPFHPIDTKFSQKWLFYPSQTRKLPLNTVLAHKMDFLERSDLYRFTTTVRESILMLSKKLVSMPIQYYSMLFFSKDANLGQ